MTVNIEVIQDGVLDLLSGLERLDLIRVNIPVKQTVEKNEKLSELYAGALKLSDANYEKYQNTLREGRSEWNRVIY